MGSKEQENYVGLDIRIHTLKNRLIRLAAFQDPEFYKAIAVLPIVDKAGLGYVRSTVEAFLYHRFETLPTIAGRFYLNVELAIPFDGLEQMEVDLLCDDVRITVKIDGEQHLADPAAYQYDRRKDILLQENVYMVLRFLVENVSKHLNKVWDALLRAVSRSDTHRISYR